MTLQDILKSLRINYLESGHTHARPGWLQIEKCPFCHSIKYHLGYNLRLGYFNCWKCGAHPTIQTLVKLGLPYEEAKAFYGARPLYHELKDRIRVGLKEPGGRTKLLPPHRRYLQSREFDPDEIEKVWQVEGIGIAHRLAWRIYIPIQEGGQRVSWTTRAIGEKVSQRYVSASASEEAINHKHLVYGIDLCLHSIIVVEGPTDAWRLGPGAGALFGTGYSPSQVRRLLRIPNRFICFDNSPDAQARGRELASQLAPFPGQTTLIEIDAKDPGSAPAREVRLLRRVAKL